MRARMLIGAGLAVALAGAMWIYQTPASAQGWGMMGGYGPGGQDAGGWTCPGFGRGGFGPGMMMGYGYGYDRQSDGQTGENLNLTTDNVKARVERMLAWRGNPRLKLGDVKEKDADTITADVVTKDNSLVQRFDFNRHNGSVRPEED